MPLTWTHSCKITLIHLHSPCTPNCLIISVLLCMDGALWEYSQCSYMCEGIFGVCVCVWVGGLMRPLLSLSLSVQRGSL